MRDMSALERGIDMSRVEEKDRDRLPGHWQTSARKLGIDGLSRDETARHFWVYKSRPGQPFAHYLVCDHWGSASISDPAAIVNELYADNERHKGHAQERAGYGDYDGVNRIEACKNLAAAIVVEFGLATCANCAKVYQPTPQQEAVSLCPTCLEPITQVVDKMRQRAAINADQQEAINTVLEQAGITMQMFMVNGDNPICLVLSEPNPAHAIQGRIEFSGVVTLTAKDAPEYEMKFKQLFLCLALCGMGEAYVHRHERTDQPLAADEQASPDTPEGGGYKM